MIVKEQKELEFAHPENLNKIKGIPRGLLERDSLKGPIRKAFSNGAGFTLIEIIIVVLIVGVISAIGVALFLEATEALSFLTVRTDLTQSADVALSRISREIRRLRDDRSIDALTNPNTFAFYDVNDNLIVYYKSINNNNLIRDTSSSSDILASNLATLTFTYYDDDGNVLSNPAVGLGTLTNIRRIEVSFTLQSGAYTFNFKTNVRPRNLRHLSYKFS